MTPKWRTIIGASYFTISLDEWGGSLLEYNADLAYLFHRNLGIGAGYYYFDVDPDRNTSKKDTHLDYSYNGVQIYGIWYF